MSTPTALRDVPAPASIQKPIADTSQTNRKPITELSPEVRARLDEDERRRLVEAEDIARFGSGETRIKAAAELSAQLGVTTRWLIDFTEEHGCWDWPTWQVVECVVRPRTAATRCRFLELPEMRSATCRAGGRTVSVVGQAAIYVSHAWGASWGTLVAALTSSSSETRRVWLDVFALRQVRGPKAIH